VLNSKFEHRFSFSGQEINKQLTKCLI